MVKQKFGKALSFDSAKSEVTPVVVYVCPADLVFGVCLLSSPFLDEKTTNLLIASTLSYKKQIITNFGPSLLFFTQLVRRKRLLGLLERLKNVDDVQEHRKERSYRYSLPQLMRRPIAGKPVKNAPWRHQYRRCERQMDGTHKNNEFVGIRWKWILSMVGNGNNSVDLASFSRLSSRAIAFLISTFCFAW